jgi:Fur family transcriptional regulator, ferric uptake regulator
MPPATRASRLLRSDIVNGVTWSEHTLAVLRDAGFRSGGARAAVVELLGSQRCCLTAQEIHEETRRRGRSVGIASVYRVLDLLSEQGLIARIDVGDQAARYEPALPGGDHHHHVVCDDCGKVEAWTDEGLERAVDRVAGKVGYRVAGHDVVLRGLCVDCR